MKMKKLLASVVVGALAASSMAAVANAARIDLITEPVATTNAIFKGVIDLNLVGDDCAYLTEGGANPLLTLKGWTAKAKAAKISGLKSAVDLTKIPGHTIKLIDGKGNKIDPSAAPYMPAGKTSPTATGKYTTAPTWYASGLVADQGKKGIASFEGGMVELEFEIPVASLDLAGDVKDAIITLSGLGLYKASGNTLEGLDSYTYVKDAGISKAEWVAAYGLYTDAKAANAADTTDIAVQQAIVDDADATPAEKAAAQALINAKQGKMDDEVAALANLQPKYNTWKDASGTVNDAKAAAFNTHVLANETNVAVKDVEMKYTGVSKGTNTGVTGDDVYFGDVKGKRGGYVLFGSANAIPSTPKKAYDDGTKSSDNADDVNCLGVLGNMSEARKKQINDSSKIELVIGTLGYEGMDYEFRFDGKGPILKGTAGKNGEIRIDLTNQWVDTTMANVGGGFVFDTIQFVGGAFVNNWTSCTGVYLEYGVGELKSDIKPGESTASGDANNDGKITAVDALMVLKLANGTPTPEQIAANDMNSDGNLTASDSLMILKKANTQAA